jgi:hypothetical protein
MSSGMAVNRGRALCAAARLVTDENLDLYILAGAALTFTHYLFTGESMARLIQTGRDDIRRIMCEGGHVRVLLLDPDDPGLLRAADRTGERLLEGRIRNTLKELLVRATDLR